MPSYGRRGTDVQRTIDPRQVSTVIRALAGFAMRGCGTHPYIHTRLIKLPTVSYKKKKSKAWQYTPDLVKYSFKITHGITPPMASHHKEA